MKKITTLVLPIMVALFSCKDKSDVIKPTPVYDSYYVSSETGNDSSDGRTINSSWKTLKNVNSIQFEKGSKLYLSGELNGSIIITNDDSLGLITSYGKRAVIKSDSTAILLYNKGGIEISNITLIGSGDMSLSKHHSGVSMYSDDDKVYTDITIRGVVAKHFSSAGIWMGLLWETQEQVNKYTGHYEDVLIRDCVADSNGFAGISLNANWPNRIHKRISVINCNTHNNLGRVGERPHTGHGIIIAGVGERGLIDSCYASYNGWKNGAGNVGIWYYDTNDGVIQHCKVWKTTTTNKTDGGGIDLDGGVSNSIVQYNMTWNNDGEGYLAYEYGSPNKMINNIFRYNISYEDCLKIPTYGAMTYGGREPQYDLQVYNNTFFMTSGIPFQKIGAHVQGTFIMKNNILYGSLNPFMAGEQAANLILVNPLLDSVFTPKEGSLVINKGVTINGSLVDYYGKPIKEQVDIGAVEKQ